ncbi:MAG: beta strand repeat-containing protein [Opitutaceae bacterium]
MSLGCAGQTMLRFSRLPISLSLAAALAAFPNFGSAKDIYVTEAGAGEGLSAQDPASVRWFDIASNWGAGAGQISPGDTVHLMDAITPIGSGASINVLAGSGARATATISGGVVVGINLTTGGSGYTTATVVLSGGGGSGAIATATVSAGQLTGITVSNGGTDYSSAPKVTILGPITGLAGLVGGTGYNSDTVVEFSGGGGSGGVAKVTVSGGQVTAIALTSGGSYANPPVAVIIGCGLIVQASGTAGNPITLQFDPGANMTAPVWSSAYGAIDTNAKQYIVVDGGSGRIGGYLALGVVNGVIQNTANGSSLAYQIPSGFVRMPDSSNVTVRNLALYNLYVRTSTTDEAPAAGAHRDWSAIASFTNSGGARTNVWVDNCVIHDAFSGFYMDYTVGCSNFQYSDSTAYACNWGGNCGDDGSGASLTGLQVYGDYFHDFTNWEDLPTDNFHHNGFYGWAVSGGTLTGIRYYDNVVGPNFGSASSGLFCSGAVSDVVIYNNIFVENSEDKPADGLAYCSPDRDVAGTYAILNNTFVGGGVGIGVNFYRSQTGSSVAQTLIVQNNIFSGLATAVALFNIDTNVSFDIEHDIDYNLNNGQAFCKSASNVGAFLSLAQWQALGYDANSLTQDPDLNADYSLGTASPAVDTGLDESAYFATAADIIGTPRPQGAGWDIGAYELIQSGSAAQSITFVSMITSVVYGTGPFSLAATASSGLAVSYSSSNPAVATISGNTVTIVGAGQTTITASQAGNSAFSAASSVQQVLTVALAGQAISFGALSIVPYGSGPIELAATADSGLSVSYSSSNPSVATVSGDMLTIVGPGATEITASQAGSSEYAAATSVVRALLVTSPNDADGSNQSGSGDTGSGGSGSTGNTSTSGGAAGNNSTGSGSTGSGSTGAATPTYAGTYFGTFSDGGQWALYVSQSATGVFIAYEGGQALVENVNVDSGGSFEISNLVSAQSTGGRQPDAVSSTVSGRIDGASVTGSGESVSLAGTQDSTVTLAAFSGLYTGSALAGANGTISAVVGGDGRAFVVIESGSSSDAASGTLNSSGNLTVSTLAGNTLAFAVTAVGRITASLTPGASTTVVRFAGLASSTPSTTRLINLSARAYVGLGSDSLVAGFVVQGGTKSILVRADGPELASYGVADTLQDPELSLFSGTATIDSNEGWGGTAALAALFAQVKAFPLPAKSADDALATSVSAGSYTAQIVGSSGDSGVALAEVYDADTGSLPAGRLANLSARAWVGTGGQNLTAGFVISGNGPEQVLIRGVGPTLTNFGVIDPLSAPQLQLFDSNGNQLTSNSGWGGSAALSNVFSEVGAFSLPSNSQDAALLVTLAPGSYTAVVTGANGATGIALIEIYEVP